MFLEYRQKQLLIRSDIYVTSGENLRRFPGHSNASIYSAAALVDDQFAYYAVLMCVEMTFDGS